MSCTPFQAEAKLFHHQRSRRAAAGMRRCWNGVVNAVEKSRRRRINARESGMTCDANWRNPVSSWRSRSEHHGRDLHNDISSRRYSSLSGGRLASIRSVSRLRPRNSRRVVGQTVFSGWKLSPRVDPRPMIHVIAALAVGAGVPGAKMGRKSSR